MEGTLRSHFAAHLLTCIIIFVYRRWTCTYRSLRRELHFQNLRGFCPWKCLTFSSQTFTLIWGAWQRTRLLVWFELLVTLELFFHYYSTIGYAKCNRREANKKIFYFPYLVVTAPQFLFFRKLHSVPMRFGCTENIHWL